MAEKTGRKSKFDSELTKVAVEFMAKQGLTDEAMSNKLGVSRSTFSKWKAENEDFYNNLKDWKKEADGKVEKSLYQRALGYKYDEVCVEGDRTRTTTKEVAPDVVAQIFWLKNRMPNEWRDKKEVEHSGEITVLAEKIGSARNRFEVAAN